MSCSRTNVIALLALLGLGYAAPAVAQVTITQPAGTVTLRPAAEWATQTFQDPMNMAERTDLGWFHSSVDQPPSNLTNVTFSAGRFSATATTSDPNVWILETGIPPSARLGKTGDNYPIDASNYRVLAVRMRLASQSPGVRASDGQLLWWRNTIYDSPTSVAGSFWTYGGWQVY